jgi:GntR family carbon starvation induced transcriptional regulator
MRAEPESAADTLADRAASLVEADILSGALAPESRLGITETAARYGVGATPLREALSRLAARGLVLAIGQRGFRVKSISRQDLADIARLRILIEREALRLSMIAGDDAWEGEIIAAFHRLKRYVAAKPSSVREGEAAFDALHKGFHTALISACGSPRMLAAHSDLYDQAYRYRRLMMASFTDLDEFLRSHETLARMTIERSESEACAAIGAHIAATLSHAYPNAEPVA